MDAVKMQRQQTDTREAAKTPLHARHHSKSHCAIQVCKVAFQTRGSKEAPNAADENDCLLHRKKRRSDQSKDEYHRARMAEAQKFLAGRDWACMWAMSVCNWNEHCQRPRNEKIWSHHILKWRNGEWLDSRRLFYLQQIAAYWTTKTRCDQVRPCKRWHEGLETASQFLDQHIDLWNLRLTNHAICSST